MVNLALQALPDIPLILPGDDIALILLRSLESANLDLEDGDILVLAQKIISKAEGRLFNLTEIIPSSPAYELAEKAQKDPRFVELVLRETKEVLRVRSGTIIVEHKLGFVCANAGIDHSNIHGPWGNPQDWVLLLPEDPDSSAAKIRSVLEIVCNARIGVSIIDTHGRAWRSGVVGVTIGLSGLPGLVDLRGQTDLFGYKLRITQVAAADELAAAASLIMGQAAESTPAIHVRGFPYPLRDSSSKELIRSKELDLFR